MGGRGGGGLRCVRGESGEGVGGWDRVHEGREGEGGEGVG